ncbi:MAG: AbgT family transporter [Verrucomicrobia bacterium]|nr:AbgT family transporter [Verrucomicrobiota bacterium]
MPEASIPTPTGPPTLLQRFLDKLEYFGNKLPDPAMIFVVALALTWLASAVLSRVEFKEIDPRTAVRDASGQLGQPAPIKVKNMLSPDQLTLFVSKMVKTFTDFPPLGVVLVALLGVAVAEHAGFINAGIKYLLQVTPVHLLTPALVLVGIVSHSAGDTGYVLVVPLGGLIFGVAGRHPVAGICAAFAGVAGGFSASFLPSSLDPLLQGFTQSAAQFINPARTVNPLCNWYFMSASTLVILITAWLVTDKLIEPRLNKTLKVDGSGGGDGADLRNLSDSERRGFWAGMASAGFLTTLLVLIAWPASSPLRAKDGSLTAHGAPLMDSLVPLIALFFFVPGLVHGYIAGTVRSHRDVVQGVAKSMGTMGYYLVMAFCAAQFTYVFRESNVGALIAIKGAAFLKALALPGAVTIVGIIAITTSVNLLIGSASAKWALLGPIFVPMLMQLGYSPEFTQAAYRIGDSSTNIITPLLPYFPLVVVYCQRHSKATGVGTLISSMIPYTVFFLITWTSLLLIWWGLKLPLGLQSSYTP